MKKSIKICVLTLAGVLALGGATTGLAFAIKAASASNNATIDSNCLDLTFNDRTGTFGDITTLTPETPVKKVISVNIDKSGVVEGTYGITYTFSATSDVKVEIFDEDPVTSNILPIGTLTKSNGAFTTNPIDVEQATYTNYVKFSISPEYSGVLDGTLSVESVKLS